MACVRSPDDPHIAAAFERVGIVARCLVIGEAVRSGARGEFGALVPVRPAVKEV
ncbi:hypothetical protein [Amycolatopsis plumensis]|uniref:hypothetical protein n=1 Tax=Amycolatopsis plumensis TaxID=236508 RepID=UPI0036227A6C